jgi:hypothetical protein
MLSFVMLNAANSTFMLSVVMLNVITLKVVAPVQQHAFLPCPKISDLDKGANALSYCAELVNLNPGRIIKCVSDQNQISENE